MEPVVLRCGDFQVKIGSDVAWFALSQDGKKLTQFHREPLAECLADMRQRLSDPATKPERLPEIEAIIEAVEARMEGI